MLIPCYTITISTTIIAVTTTFPGCQPAIIAQLVYRTPVPLPQGGREGCPCFFRIGAQNASDHSLGEVARVLVLLLVLVLALAILVLARRPRKSPPPTPPPPHPLRRPNGALPQPPAGGVRGCAGGPGILEIYKSVIQNININTSYGFLYRGMVRAERDGVGGRRRLGLRPRGLVRPLQVAGLGALTPKHVLKIWASKQSS